MSPPVRYGARIAASVVDLASSRFVPEDRLARLMADRFGVTLARASIGAMSARAAERLAGFADAVRALVVGAPVKHRDETGFRIGGRTRWLHVAVTPRLSFYRVSAKRGDLPAGVSVIVVHDHWKPYHTMPDVTHALWQRPSPAGSAQPVELPILPPSAPCPEPPGNQPGISSRAASGTLPTY